MRIKLISEYGLHSRGTVVDFPPPISELLIARGKAEKLSAPAASKKTIVKGKKNVHSGSTKPASKRTTKPNRHKATSKSGK